MSSLLGYGEVARGYAPQGDSIPQINRSHPLSDVLVAAYYPGAFPSVPIINLASPGSGDLNVNGGGAFLGNTPEGPGLALTGTATNLFARAVAPPQMILTGNFSNGLLSAFVRGQWTGNSGTNVPASIFSVTYNTTAGSSPFWAWLIGATPPSGTTQRVGIGYAVSSASFIYDSFSNPAIAINKMVSVGISLNSGVTGASTSAALYQDGVKYLSATHNYGFYGATPWIALGDPSARGRNAAFTVTVAYLFRGSIGDDGMATLNSEPYGLLKSPADIVYNIVGPTAAPTLPASNPSSPMLSPLTVGLGAAARAGIILRRNPLLSRRNTMFGRWEQ